MDAREFLIGEYMDAVAFKGQRVTKTISAWEKRDVEKIGGKKKDEDGDAEMVRKLIITFGDVRQGMPNKWITCKLTVRCLIEMFGHETNDWIGKKVTLFPDAEKKSASGFAIRVWGSPDIAQQQEFVWKQQRKRDRTIILHKTAPGPQPASEPTL